MVVGPMWAGIARVGKEAFSQAQAEEIFVKARSFAESKWPRSLTATEVVEWGPAIARQFRFMCSHVTAGRAEKTQWAQEIFGGQESWTDPPPPAAAVAAVPKAAAPAPAAAVPAARPPNAAAAAPSSEAASPVATRRAVRGKSSPEG
jgi:hypothetical protein